MKSIHLISLTLVLFSMSPSANARDDNAELLALVHKNGFTGCDTAISKEFEGYVNSSEGRVSVDSIDDKPRTLSVIATWGKVGDSVFQRTVFERNGATCNTYQTSMISYAQNCIAYKEKNPV